jgi:hypothetical protein
LRGIGGEQHFLDLSVVKDQRGCRHPPGAAPRYPVTGIAA